MPRLLNDLKLAELKELASKVQLATSGTKADLVVRLTTHFGSEQVGDEFFETNQGHNADVITELRDEISKLKEMIATIATSVSRNLNVNATEQVSTPQRHTSTPCLQAGQNDEATVPDDGNRVPSNSFSNSGPILDHTNSGARSFNQVRDIVEILPIFDPTNPESLSSKHFVTRVERLQDVYHWDERVLLFAAQAKLQGHAKAWNDGQIDVFTSWTEFKTRLTQDFPCHQNEADIHLGMASTSRQTGETVLEYIYKMNAKGRRGGMDDSSIIKYIRVGLKHSHLQNSIASGQFQTVNELIATVQRYLSNYVSNSRPNTDDERPAKGPNRNRDGGNAQTARTIADGNDNRTTNTSTRSSTSTSTNDRKQPICYNCREVGHISINCTKSQRKPRCSRCQKTGHEDRNCPNQDRTNTEAPNPVRLIKEGPPITITKDVYIQNMHFVAVIDPGATRSLIRRSSSLNLSVQPEQANIALKGFAGGSYVCREKIPVRIGIDGDDFDGYLCIVEDEFLSEPLLLGSDLLCRDDVRLTIEAKECRLERVNPTKLNVNDELNECEKQQLQSLVIEYADCFAEKLSQLGRSRTTTMKIQLQTKIPTYRQPYRVPFAKKEVLRKLIQDMLDCSIIRPSESAYSSPIVLVRKKSGEERFCVDYRVLNSITVKQPFPMPVVEEQLASLAGNNFFTTLDLMSGYYQIPIDEDSKRFTAFSTDGGHYEFNSMPFGLVNAPGVFQRVINGLIQKMEPGEAIAYLDDIIIPSVTIEEGYNRLRRFFEILREAGLTLRPDKCVFFAREINFLGHRVSRNGVQPGEEKTACIQNFPRPNDIHSVRRFLGLCGFFRKFVKEFARLSQPLTKLLRTKNGQVFEWSAEQEAAFEQLKLMLCSEPILQLYDPQCNHELHTDASATGLAGVLMQEDVNGEYKVVAYYSRQCTDIEKIYHSHELEGLAVTESLSRFRYYLLGKHFRIVTDCSAVSSLKARTPMSPRVARWLLKLQEYDYDIVHRSGEKLPHADALSRAPFEPPKEAKDITDAVLRIEVTQDEWLSLLQLQDPKIRRIYQVLKGEISDEQEKQIKSEFDIKHGRVYKLDGTGHKFVLPAGVRWRLLQHYHDKMGHYSIDKTLQRVKQDFWFPRMRSIVKQYVKNCLECCYNKGKGGQAEGQLHVDKIIPIPFATLQIDHLGPFVKSKRQNTHLIVVTDIFSKYVVVRAVKNTKTQPVLVLLNDLTSYFGLPMRIVSDRGTAYTSKGFEEYCKRNQIQHIKTAVRTPRANGQAERVNQTVLTYLRTSTDDPRDWDANVNKMQWVLNTQKNSTTGFSSNEIIFDFRLRDVIPNRLIEALHDDGEHHRTTDEPTTMEKRDIAERRINEQRLKWKERFDTHHKTPRVYEKDDLVVIENQPNATGESRKLEPKYRGPYVVTKVLDRDRYLVEDVDGHQRTQKQFSSVFSAEKLKLWGDQLTDMDQFDEDDHADEDHTDDEDESEPRTVECQEGPTVNGP